MAPLCLAQNTSPNLDFPTYRSRVEPIFLKTREAGVRCYDCHSALATRFRLVPFSSRSASWTEAQSRENFRNVLQVVSQADPAKSPLLVHPLAPQAGGDSAHTGGKFWKSKDDPEWRTIANWIGIDSATASLPPSSVRPENFAFFKTNIEPIFLKVRAGHARCYSCHVLENRNFRLEPLSADKGDWSDEQSLKNMRSVMQQIVPGDPTSSRLLMHPLAPEAGGDPFHSGGRQFQTQNDPDWVTLAAWVRGLGQGTATANGRVQIFVTNSAEDTIDVIDAESNKVVQVIGGIELPHGIAFAPDGSKIYVSNESENVLDEVDRRNGQIVRKVLLSGRPNNLAISKDGRRVLVGIRKEPGAVDVIDTSSLRLVKSIPVKGSVHNVFVTPDGKYAISGSIEGKAATVIDLATETVAWTVQFDSGVRPMAFGKNPDGSTARMFVQLSGVHGFAVVDFAKRAEVQRIMLPDQPRGFGIKEGRNGTPSHGIGVAPDGKFLWVNSTLANATFKYSLPDLKLLGWAELPLVHPMDAGQPVQCRSGSLLPPTPSFCMYPTQLRRRSP